jgi:hypothetical protein
MASWQEIDRIRKDPAAMRALAKRLSKSANEGFTPWETSFLESIALKVDTEQFSSRQAEKLLEIRDDSDILDTYRGFSLKALLKNCREAHLDLSEADEEWILEIPEGTTTLKRRQARHLLRCARVLRFIDQEEDAA